MGGKGQSNKHKFYLVSVSYFPNSDGKRVQDGKCYYHDKITYNSETEGNFKREDLVFSILVTDNYWTTLISVVP